MTARFWMVIDMQPGNAASRRHDSALSAETEAERLTVKEGRPFGVLELVGICKPAPKTLWEDPAEPGKGGV